ncbi:unnamed protein product [Pylaiella littoralis]
MPWMHPNPRKRYGIETARFFLYVSVPVVVITICSDPKNMNMLLRGFNFVEYPPESKKLPSGTEVVKMMKEREAKRRIVATRSGIDAHLAAAGAAAGAVKRVPTSPSVGNTTLDATAKVAPPPESSRGGDQAPPAAATKRGWFGWR